MTAWRLSLTRAMRCITDNSASPALACLRNPLASNGGYTADISLAMCCRRSTLKISLRAGALCSVIGGSRALEKPAVFPRVDLLLKGQVILAFVLAIHVDKFGAQLIAHDRLMLHGAHGIEHFQGEVGAAVTVFVQGGDGFLPGFK